jgi:lipopolysaccharide/colanic/teichoic acid biosynthesis glycosyltransferase
MRFAVKPGMVSLTQMARRTYSFDETMALDRQYIKDWSLLTDVKIIFGVALRYIKGAR